MDVRQAPADPEVTLRSERDAPAGAAPPGTPASPDARTQDASVRPQPPAGAADTGDGLVSERTRVGPKSRPARQRIPFSQRPSPYSVGEVVADKYQLVSMIGRGGMGEVWHARHRELATDVAIKFLDRERHASASADDDEVSSVLARFRFEAQVSARLGARTRHIVAAYDAGTHREAPYLVMELVRGRTLESIIDELGAVPPARMALVLEQVADALAVAHQLGIVHRDIKPANIMLVEPTGADVMSSITGEATLMAKLADFGVAKALHSGLNIERPKDTAEGLLVGSPAYMSPEQLRAEGSLSAASDIWSLGVVTYEALTGWPAFTAGSIAELIVAISTRTPEAPSSVRATVPASVDGWFTRALAKEAGDRFATAPEAASAFREALRAPAAAAPRGAGWRGLVAAIATLVVLGSIFIAVRTARSPSEQPSGPSTALAAPPPVDPPPITREPAPPASAAALPATAASPVTTAPSASAAAGKRPPAARPAAAETAAVAPPTPVAPPPAAPPSAPPAATPPPSSTPPPPPKEYDPSDTQ